jgi:hypothetical protein
VTIKSEPPDAVVWLNHTEIGRTPVTTGFTYYGDYDVRLRREGYEPLVTHSDVGAPIYEQVPLDLIATALPVRIKTNREMSFTMEPSPAATPENQAGLVERARALRGELAAREAGR